MNILDDIKIMKHKNDVYSNIIGQNLRTLRKDRGVNQKAVAEYLGIDQASVSGWERGSRAMTVEHFFQLCEFFDVSADYLAGRDVDVALDDTERDILTACRMDAYAKASISHLLGIEKKSVADQAG